MIVTVNEVEQWSLRAMAGSGAPAGIDEDAAKATAWLAAHGFPAIGMLVSALDRWAGDTTAARIGEGTGEDGARQFDTGGRSATFLGSTLIDLAVADAVRSKAAGKIEVRNLADPLFLLPAAERYRRDGMMMEILWRSPEDKERTRIALDRAGPQFFGNIDTLQDAAPVTASISCTPRSGALLRAPDGNSVTPVLGPDDLEIRYEITLETGLDVEDGIWNRLKSHGQHALVPATAQSRARGAGAAGNDNE